MREIKFRVWCKQTEEMHAVERLGFENGELWYIEDEDRETEPPYFPDRNDSVLMQYTGLKDKYGQEIYEGDIVEYGLLTGKILFDSGAFQFEILKSEQSHLIGERDCLIDLSEDGFEIIGNIYENAELLEEAK